MTFIELRNVFAAWCDLSSDRSTTPHAYGVTSVERHCAYTCSDVKVASALLNSIVRHESRYTAPEGARVTRTIRAAIHDLTHGEAHSLQYPFCNPFDVITVLVASLDGHTSEVRSAAASWIVSMESAGRYLRAVSARRIARAITMSNAYARAMERGYAPGGRIANALKDSYERGL